MVINFEFYLEGWMNLDRLRGTCVRINIKVLAYTYSLIFM